MKKTNSSAIDLLKYKMQLVYIVNILVLSGILGLQGAGYLGISLAALIFFAAFHSFWIFAVVAKYVRGRNVRGQHRSSQKFFMGALAYALLTGVAFCAGLMPFSEKLGVFLFRDNQISICLMLVSALLFLQGVSEAIGGYLQGMGFYQPVKLFYLVRQAAVFIASMVGVKSLEQYGGKVARLKHNDAVISVYGAFGALLGIIAGCMIGLALLLVFFLLLSGEMQAMRRRDNAKYRETAMRGFQTMCSFGMLRGIRYAILFAPLLINYILYIWLCKEEGNSEPWIKTGGFLFGEAVPVMLMLILLFVILNHKNYRLLAGYWKTEAYAQFREKVFAILLGVFVLAMPICGAIAVMAKPILKCLTGSAAKEGEQILLYAAIGAMLLILECIAYQLMEIWNAPFYLSLTTVVSFVVQTVFAAGAFQALDLGVSGILFGMLMQAGLFIVFFFAKFARYIRFTGEQLKKLTMSVILSLASSLIMLLLYQIVGKKLSAGISIGVCVIPGILLYLAAITLLRIISDKEAEQAPGGTLFLWLNGMLRR